MFLLIAGSGFLAVGFSSTQYNETTQENEITPFGIASLAIGIGFLFFGILFTLGFID